MIQTTDCSTATEPNHKDFEAPRERIPSTPPVINTVPKNISRPLWSVMIPVYNCINYLRETLECVLKQDAGPEQMQIAVIDDCSTDGDIEALVREIAGDRIEYYRQSENQGSLRNFETCLNRSVGHLVHLLHGDDQIMPGFYAEINQLFNKFPEAGAAFTNIAHVQSDGKLMYLHKKLSADTCILDDFLVQNAKQLLVQPPAIVVKRSVYEQLGGFYAVHYGEDREMWTRISAHFPIAYSPRYFAKYRYYTENSITKQSILTGRNIYDVIKIIDIMQSYLPAEKRVEVKRESRLEYALYCVALAGSLYRTNRSAAIIQAKGALLMSNDIRVYKELAKFLLRGFGRYEKIKTALVRLRRTFLLSHE
ncbi:glycosyltransferase family 2 protein [Hymenobacter cheonanensis]|uniref:glycosyltransferase family 2 protein n=1 Tax=Hymenobacter sp. CA2-7 TaxID=3063993 RepID=UPI0027124EA2|nr:glycosyltransferase [Hymenobacter sp. CA2-7]MDO7885543.1 glycosyltransferase [Hymenobacter sp. CA2-7]